MATRALIHLKVEDSRTGLQTTFATIYHHFDGYPEYLGRKLVEFVGPKLVVNGISGDRSNIANGPGCLFAQLIAELKDDVGNVYIEAPGQVGKGEEYTYEVVWRTGAPHAEVLAYDIDSNPIDLREALAE